MTTQPQKKRIIVELDLNALDRARRDEGLSRTTFARSMIVRCIRAAAAAQEAAR